MSIESRNIWIKYPTASEELQNIKQLEKHRLCPLPILNIDTGPKQLKRRYTLRPNHRIKGKRPSLTNYVELDSGRGVYLRTHVAWLGDWKGDGAFEGAGWVVGEKLEKSEVVTNIRARVERCGAEKSTYSSSDVQSEFMRRINNVVGSQSWGHR